jgi:hypothetical protein
MTVKLITDITRYQGLSSDPKPVDAKLGSIFFEEDTGKTYIKVASGWVEQALSILSDSGNSVTIQHPLPTNSDSVYQKDVNVDGSDIGTFTGDIVSLFNDLDTTFSSTGHSSPAWFEVKLNRPIDNNSIKFCSPDTKNFSNVKIILKDRAGTVLDTVDDSTNDTDYPSNRYDWRFVDWCTIRVEFHTTDDIDINWAILDKSVLVHTAEKHLSLKNSTTTLLPADTGGSDHIYTGTWIRTGDYSQAIISVTTDKDAATDGLRIEVSDDGVTSRHAHTFSVLANTPYGHHYASTLDMKYMRIIYENGTDAQTIFSLFTTLFVNQIEEGHVHGLDFELKDDHQAITVRSIAAGKNVDGQYRNVGITSRDGLKVSNIESGLAIARGDVPGDTFIHKFGNAPDFDAADGFVTVWDGANDGGTNEMQYNYSTSADIDSISSSNNGDTQSLEIWGLDASYDEVIQTKSLTGQTRVALDTPMVRVYRMINRGNSDLAGTAYCFVNTALNLGVPIDTTKVRAIITLGNNQTLMAVYTVPDGNRGYMRDWYASTAGAKKTSVHVVKLVTRPFNQVFQTKHVASIAAAGSSNIHHKYEEPEVLEPKTDIEILANSDEDVAAIAAGFDIVIEEI